MPITPADSGAGALTPVPRPPPCGTGSIDADIYNDPFTWEDDMIKRMSKELQRQLSQVEGQKFDSRMTATERAANARTLATLQRMMAQLARQHKDNAGARANDLENNANYKDAVISKLSRLIASISENGVSGPPERK